MNKITMYCLLASALGWAGMSQASIEAAEQSSEVEVTAAELSPSAAAEPITRAAIPPGTATRSLLKAQAQGDSASTHQYPMSGAVAHKAYERYVNSFAHPIPEQSASTIAKSGK